MVVATILGGFASIASLCVLPLVPILISGTVGEDPRRPGMIVSGIVMGFFVITILNTVYSQSLSSSMRIIEITNGILISFSGILLIAEEKMLSIFSWSKSTWDRLSGLALGLLIGIVWIPCIGTELSQILTLLNQKFANAFFLLIIYSFSFAIPLLLVAYLWHFLRAMSWFQKAHRARLVQWFHGIVLVLFGIYIVRFGTFIL